MAAPNVKGKRKCKGKTLNLTTFLGEDQDAPTGFAVVNSRRIDWGDAMENEDLDDRYTLDFKKDEKLVLPTAPKAARGPDVDMNKVPTKPPFTAFLGNLPYDVSEDDIANFFRQLQVTNVRLPRENGDKGRIRGFGYAEFHDRNNLIQALALNNDTLKNRAIKVSLAGEQDGDRDRRDGGSDRTMGDWRSDKRDQFSRDDSSRNDGDRRDGGIDRTLGDWRSDKREESSRNDSYTAPRGGFSDRESSRGSFDNFSRDRYERNERNGERYERSDYSNRNDRDFGRDQDRFDRRSADRGYGFSDRGMNRSAGRNDRRETGGRDYRDSFSRREDSSRDFRYKDSSDRDPPNRDSYDRRQPDRPSYDSEGPKERRKLQLAPRTKPIEPTPPPAEAVSASSIFGGAKPVDTAAKEREIEERLEKEREGKEPKDSDDPRVRRFSTGSGVSNRSRRSSDSGPPGVKEDEDPIPQYKPPIPRQLDRDTQQYNTLPRTRQRCSSNSSTGSEREGPRGHPPISRKESYNSNYTRIDDSDDAALQSHNTENSYTESTQDGFRNVRHPFTQRETSRDKTLHGSEEPKPPVYASVNKFSHLANDLEDVDPGSDSD